MTGTIARKMDKGYGFFHAKELVGVMFDELNEGDAVTFEVAEGPKGANAVNVQRA